jgi:hypothetical protein
MGHPPHMKLLELGCFLTVTQRLSSPIHNPVLFGKEAS